MENIETLIDADTIANKVRELGAQITEDYREKELVLVPVLKGSFVFAADLSRAIDLPLSIDFTGGSLIEVVFSGSGKANRTGNGEKAMGTPLWQGNILLTF